MVDVAQSIITTVVFGLSLGITGKAQGQFYCGIPRQNYQGGGYLGVGGLSGFSIGGLAGDSEGANRPPTGIVGLRDEIENMVVIQPRILGGTNVQDITRNCWIAAIYADNNYIASGALINAQWVLTSAHAVRRYKQQNNPYITIPVLTVRLGQINANNQLNQQQQFSQYKVSSVEDNPEYKTVGPGYPVGDVALLRLNTTVDLNANPTLCGACLPQPNQAMYGERCHAAGYGVTAENAQATDGQLREVSVQIIPSQICDLVLRNIFRSQTYTTDPATLCAGGELGKDTCVKDAGAPLSCMGLPRSYPVLVGVSSWGSGCGRYGTPSMYANLSNPAVLTWIQTISGGSYAPLGGPGAG